MFSLIIYACTYVSLQNVSCFMYTYVHQINYNSHGKQSINMYVYVYFVVRKSQCETTGAKGGKGGAARHKKKQAACSLTLSNSKIPVAKCAK